MIAPDYKIIKIFFILFNLSANTCQELLSMTAVGGVIGRRENALSGNQ
jgi:hypothetical protein